MKQKETPAFEFLAAPARRALASIDISKLQDLGKHSEEDIKKLHGIGTSAIERLKDAMANAGVSFKTNSKDPVSDYIKKFPDSTALLLRKLRATIQAAAPEAEEHIGYGMPAYKQNGPLVYFAGYAHHIGFYPTGERIQHFTNALSSYKTSKGAVQFPLDQELPHDLIRTIVQHRVRMNTKNRPKGR